MDIMDIEVYQFQLEAWAEGCREKIQFEIDMIRTWIDQMRLAIDATRAMASASNMPTLPDLPIHPEFLDFNLEGIIIPGIEAGGLPAPLTLREILGDEWT
jgi:hypothetical protein